VVGDGRFFLLDSYESVGLLCSQFGFLGRLVCLSLLFDGLVVSLGGGSLFCLRLGSMISFVFLSFCFVLRSFFDCSIKDCFPLGLLSIGFIKTFLGLVSFGLSFICDFFLFLNFSFDLSFLI
jgi:hypothetical protein